MLILMLLYLLARLKLPMKIFYNWKSGMIIMNEYIIKRNKSNKIL